MTVPLTAVSCEFQVFQETIEVFHQKNETFKMAAKEVEEVLVSIARFYQNWIDLHVSCWMISSMNVQKHLLVR